MSEKLCLQWNDFQENVKKSFRQLRDDKGFSDVTLACEDGQQIEAHKVILAASSPFFETVLRRNQHTHPLIYFKGFPKEDLHAVLDFLYYGEANISEGNLDSFLAIAKELKLKGLAGQTNWDSQLHDFGLKNPNTDLLPEINKETSKPQSVTKTPEPSTKRDNVSNKLTKDFKADSVENSFRAKYSRTLSPSLLSDETKSENRSRAESFRTLSTALLSETKVENSSRSFAIHSQFNGDLQELDEKVKSLMQKGQKMVSNGKQVDFKKSKENQVDSFSSFFSGGWITQAVNSFLLQSLWKGRCGKPYKRSH